MICSGLIKLTLLSPTLALYTTKSFSDSHFTCTRVPVDPNPSIFNWFLISSSASLKAFFKLKIILPLYNNKFCLYIWAKLFWRYVDISSPPWPSNISNIIWFLSLLKFSMLLLLSSINISESIFWSSLNEYSNTQLHCLKL